jgi:hypothetical protein
MAKFATENDTTPFTVLLAAFAIRIHRITGDEDTIIGTNSTTSEPFPIRVNVSSSCSFSSLLQTLREVRPPLSNAPLCRLETLLKLQIYSEFATDVVPFDDLVQYCGGIHSGEVSDSSILHLAFYKGSQVAPKIRAVLAAIPTEISICKLCVF